MKQWLAFLLLSLVFCTGCLRVSVTEEQVEVKLGGIEVTVDGDAEKIVGGGKVEPAGIREITVNWVSGSVAVEVFGGSSIEVEETADEALNEGEKLRYAVENGELTIDFCKPHMGAIDVPSKDLTLRIPESMAEALEEVEITTVSAGATIEGVAAKALKVVTVSADVVIAGTDTREVELESVSGNIVCQPESLPREIDFHAVSGSLELTLPAANDGFALELDSVSGDLISDAAVTVQGDRYLAGGGACKVECDTVSGNVKIK